MKRRTKQKLTNQWLFKLFLLLLTSLAYMTITSTTVTLPDAERPIYFYSTQNHDNLQQTIVEAISNAKESVTMVIYALTDPAVLKALRKKSEEGMKVNVICDAKASPYIDKKLGSKVQLTKRIGKGLMHQKLLVIDQSQTWIGSANMTNESLVTHGNLMSAIFGSPLAQWINAKAQTMPEYGQEQGFPYAEFTVNGQWLEFSFLPDDKKASIRIKNLIRSAQKTIRIAMYTWTRQDFAKEVIAAKNRGVSVEVVVDKNSAKGASAKVVEMLRESGIRVRENQRLSLLHYKFMYIDGKVLENGSANWTKAAFTQNDDCFMILHNLTDEQNKHLKGLWKRILEDAIIIDDPI